MIIKGNSEYYGLVDIDGELACEKCKTVNPRCERVLHIDLVKKYINSYRCTHCGNEKISVITKRTEDDLEYGLEIVKINGGEGI